MNYSFFGTCYKDHKLVKSSIISILKQTIKPKEIIIIDSGSSIKFKKWFLEKVSKKKIKPIYIDELLPRVLALNKAIEVSKAKFLLRFDSRSKFPNNYAFSCLKTLESGYKIVGGVPKAFCTKVNMQSNLCQKLMNSSYVFGYPKYRDPNYEGFANSVYLGAFDAKLLKKIKYRTDIKIISEDSQLAQDFINIGFKPYISQRIKPSYRVREEIISLLRLFNTYGFARANSILYSKSFHEKTKFIIMSILLSIILFSTFIFSIKNILLFTFISLFLYNLVGELIIRKNKLNIFIILMAILCQIFWVIGLIRGMLFFNKAKTRFSNFIK